MCIRFWPKMRRQRHAEPSGARFQRVSLFAVMQSRSGGGGPARFLGQHQNQTRGHKK
jgi:hypothetical protein